MALGQVFQKYDNNRNKQPEQYRYLAVWYGLLSAPLVMPRASAQWMDRDILPRSTHNRQASEQATLQSYVAVPSHWFGATMSSDDPLPT